MLSVIVIVIRDCQNCYQGLSKLLLGIVKIVIRDWKGLLKLFLDVVTIMIKFVQKY